MVKFYIRVISKILNILYHKPLSNDSAKHLEVLITMCNCYCFIINMSLLTICMYLTTCVSVVPYR